jgi:hypothetical protein
MPYFPNYEETQEAIEHARLKMWHEHGKKVELGGPEFTLYLMEGLGKVDVKVDVAPPEKVTVTKTMTASVDALVEEEKDDDSEDEEGVGTGDVVQVREVEGSASDSMHDFRVNRGGVNCITCGKPERDNDHIGE